MDILQNRSDFLMRCFSKGNPRGILTNHPIVIFYLGLKVKVDIVNGELCWTVMNK